MNQSIHPRVRDGRTVYPVVNTCAPSRKVRRAKAKMLRLYDRRQKEFELLVRSVGAAAASGFTRPGSRNLRHLRKR